VGRTLISRSFVPGCAHRDGRNEVGLGWRTFSRSLDLSTSKIQLYDVRCDNGGPKEDERIQLIDIRCQHQLADLIYTPDLSQVVGVVGDMVCERLGGVGGSLLRAGVFYSGSINSQRRLLTGLWPPSTNNWMAAVAGRVFWCRSTGC
jgi:hypothetical protein